VEFQATLSKKDCDELERRIEELEARAPSKAALETVEQIILVVTAVDYAYRFTFKVAPSTWKKVRGWIARRRRAAAGMPDTPDAPRRKRKRASS